MAKILYSKRSIGDLDEIGDYISKNLENPMAALDTLTKIQNAIDTLAEFPQIGSTLAAVSDTMDAAYRFLVCGNYLVFYHIKGECIYIDRILYGRRDYIAILFPN